MSAQLTLSLPQDVKQAIDRAVQAEGISPEEFIGKAVQQYLFARRFRLLRDRLIPHAHSQGIQTDQDVFDRVS